MSLLMWCGTCGRSLQNHGHIKPGLGHYSDTVTVYSRTPLRVTHDQCGGVVALSARLVAGA